MFKPIFTRFGTKKSVFVYSNMTWKYLNINQPLTSGYYYDFPYELKNAKEIEIYVGIPTINSSKQWQPLLENTPVGFFYGNNTSYYFDVSILRKSNKITVNSLSTVGWSDGVAQLLTIRYRN